MTYSNIYIILIFNLGVHEQVLVALDMDDKISAFSLDNILNRKKTVETGLSNIFAVQRSRNGQLYLFRGLSHLVHFSLGKRGMEIFKEAIGDVPINFVDGLETKHISEHLYVDSDSTMLDSIKHRLYPIATRMVPHLLKVSSMISWFLVCEILITFLFPSRLLYNYLFDTCILHRVVKEQEIDANASLILALLTRNVTNMKWSRFLARSNQEYAKLTRQMERKNLTLILLKD